MADASSGQSPGVDPQPGQTGGGASGSGISSGAASKKKDKHAHQGRRTLDDSFMMYMYKIKLCTRTTTHNWKLCPWAHPGETAALRRHPNCHSAELCPAVRGNQECPHGETCAYSRNAFECWLHPDRYRTTMCKMREACNRNICFFAHNQSELRAPPSQAPPAPLQPPQQQQPQPQPQPQLAQQLLVAINPGSVVAAGQGGPSPSSGVAGAAPGRPMVLAAEAPAATLLVQQHPGPGPQLPSQQPHVAYGAPVLAYAPPAAEASAYAAGGAASCVPAPAVSLAAQPSFSAAAAEQQQQQHLRQLAMLRQQHQLQLQQHEEAARKLREEQERQEAAIMQRMHQDCQMAGGMWPPPHAAQQALAQATSGGAVPQPPHQLGDDPLPALGPPLLHHLSDPRQQQQQQFVSQQLVPALEQQLVGMPQHDPSHQQQLPMLHHLSIADMQQQQQQQQQVLRMAPVLVVSGPELPGAVPQQLPFPASPVPDAPSVPPTTWWM